MSALHTVIGDLVGSRRVPDRAAVQEALSTTLRQLNATVEVAQPFEATVGDEFQGACARLADATLATLLVRVALLPWIDTRFGIGHGEVTVHDAARRPLLQDGPGWWAARDAIDEIGGPRESRRSWYAGPTAGRVNAFLLCRDQVVDRLNDRGHRMLHQALLGRSQKDIASEEGIWPSAVSQQFARGIGAVLEAQRLMASEDIR
jgi:hypothetical protein